MSQVILTTIFNKLTAVQTAGTVYALVGGRIFQMFAHESTALPLLVYEIENEETDPVMGAATVSLHGMDARFTFFFNRANSTVATAMAAEQALFTLLHMATLTPSDATYAGINARCISRGVPTLLDVAISVETVYRIFASKQS